MSGAVQDEETGLYYFGARYYDPRTSVWQSADPIDRFNSNSPTIGLNLYQYGLLNPLRYIDPQGTEEEESGASWWKPWTWGKLIGAWSEKKYVEAATEYKARLDARNLGEDIEQARQDAAGDPQIAAIGQEVREQGEKYGQAGVDAAAGGAIIKGVVKGTTTVIGRVKDLKNLGSNEKSLLDRLPDRGNPKANWQQNAGVLRQEMRRGAPIRDASPGDTGGQFLNAERNLLRSHGWTFDSKTNYWMPPKR